MQSTEDYAILGVRPVFNPETNDWTGEFECPFGAEKHVYQADEAEGVDYHRTYTCRRLAEVSLAGGVQETVDRYDLCADGDPTHHVQLKDSNSYHHGHWCPSAPDSLMHHVLAAFCDSDAGKMHRLYIKKPLEYYTKVFALGAKHRFNFTEHRIFKQPCMIALEDMDTKETATSPAPTTTG